MESFLSQTETAIDKAYKLVTAALDVAEVPDDHPVRVKVASSFAEVEGAVRDLPVHGRNAGAVLHPGPAVYVLDNCDMRNWPTTEGFQAGDVIVSKSRRARLASTGSRTVVASTKLRRSGKRVISSLEYIKELEKAERT